MPHLRPMQRVDVQFLKRHKLRALIASAPGTGKTPVAIRAVAETHQKSLPCLIVCPASVVRNWAKELKVWAPGIRVVMIEDTTSPVVRARDGMTAYILSWSLLGPRARLLKKIGLRTIIADEAHYAKNPDTRRSSALFDLCQQAPHVLLLTGTPIVNDEDELGVLENILGTRNPPMIRRMIEDVAPDIPEKKRSYAYIELTAEQRKEYDRADEDFASWLMEQRNRLSKDGFADAEIERTLAAEALAKVGYLRRLLGEAKVDAAVDWIARAVRVGEPVVVFLEHQHVLAALKKGLRKQRVRFGVLEGATPVKERQAVVDGFQRGDFPVFIGTRAAKEGITLTRSSNLLFLERFFTSADEEQAEDRIRRIGQDRKTTIWYLHAIDTLDDRIDHIVRAKRRIIRKAIGGEDIRETSESNVTSLLKEWGRSVYTEGRTIMPLGQGTLDPLPSPRDTQGVIFDGKAWTLARARNWCKMHGYRMGRVTILAGKFKIQVHPAKAFRDGSFSVSPVTRTVKLIVGRRKGGKAEWRVRRAIEGRR